MLALFVLACGSALGAAADQDAAFLDGLRERRLYELAEAHCRRRLAQPELPAREKAELTVQWIRTLAQQAVGAAPHERAELWRRAETVADDYLTREGTSPYALLVAYQGALVHATRGELAREEAALGIDGARDSNEATIELRTAIRQIEPLVARIGAALRGADRGQSLRSDELVSLGKNVQYQMARTLVEQAQCFAADSPDRVSALSRAVRFHESLAQLDAGDPLAWKSRLGEIACYRLLGDVSAAQQRLSALMEREPPASVAHQAQAEGIRLALALGDRRETAAMLDLTGQDGAAPGSPELDDARLEGALALWRVASEAKDATLADRWQSESNRIFARIQRRAEPYWTRRAEMLLARSLRTAGHSGDVNMLAQAAKSFYLAGQMDEALAAYDRASDLAARQGDAEAAFELGHTAAMIQQARGRHAAAMTRLRRLALDHAGQATAASIHLAAIENAAALAKQTKTGSLEVYADLLQEHLRRWPEDATSAQVHWWMGRLRQHERDWPGAIAAYAAVRPGDPMFAKAVTAATDCYEAWLGTQRAAGSPTGEVARRAAAWLESTVVDASGRVPPGLDPLGQMAVLRAARFWLDAPPEGFVRAERLLNAALAGTPGAPPAWTSAAQAALVSALAGQGRRDQADAVLQGISQAGTEAIIALLDDLARATQDAPPEVRKELAPLELRALGMLDPKLDGLDEPRARRLGWIHAQALADAGRTDEALRRYQALAARWPGDATIQEGRARLLASRGDRAALDEALAAWREIAKRTRPGQQRWFEAKYAVAELHYRLGRPRQAERVITLVTIVQPELGGPEMKARFQRLFERCQSQP